MENTDNRTKILVMVPVAFAIILLVIANSIEFEDNLSPVEKQVLNFEYRRLQIIEKQAAEPVNDLKGPFDPVRFEQGGAAEISDVPEQNKELEVSLIIVSGDSKMAIIQGVIVKEGDFIDDTRVVKIEAERVLLNNNGDKWIHVKK